MSNFFLVTFIKVVPCSAAIATELLGGGHRGKLPILLQSHNTLSPTLHDFPMELSLDIIYKTATQTELKSQQQTAMHFEKPF